MIAIENKRMERSKLLAAAVVFAMVVCAFAAVLPAQGVDAADPVSVVTAPSEEDGATYVTDYAGLVKALDNEEITQIVITASIEIPLGANVTISKDTKLYIVNSNDQTNVNNPVQLKISGTLVIEGTVYNNAGNSRATSGFFNQGVITYSGDGVLYSTSADGNTNQPENNPDGKQGVVNGFFAVIGTEADSNCYKHMYAADLSKVNAQVVSGKSIYSYGETVVDSEVTVTADFVVGGIYKQASDMTVADGVTLTLNGDTTVNSNAGLTNDGNVTLKSGNIAGTYVNNGTTTVDAADGISGTIDNQNGTVSITSYSAPATGAGLTVSGGEVTATSIDALPTIDGALVSISDNGKTENYTIYYATSSGYEVMLGIGAAQYDGKTDYAGSAFNKISVKVLQAKDPNGDSIDITSSTITFTDAIIYENPELAEAGNPEDAGTCIDAGDYCVYLKMSVSIFGTIGENDPVTNVNASFPLEIIAPFKVLPIEISNVVIKGTGTGGNIKDQTYTGGEPVLVAGTDLEADGVDFIVTATVNGVPNVVLDPETYYSFYSTPNADGKWIGDVNLVIELNGNYKCTDESELTKAYVIVEGYETITVEPNEDAVFYAGQQISANDFTFTGKYVSGQDPAAVNSGDMKIKTINGVEADDVEYFPNAESVVIVFEYNSKTTDQKLDCEPCTVTVITINKIEVTGDYNKTYTAGEAFDPSEMTVTVTFELQDGEAAAATVAFTYNNDAFAQGTTTGAANGKTFTNEILLTPEKFNTFVGDKVEVTVSYLGFEKIVYVSVDGYGIVYHVTVGGEDIIYGGQAGKYGDLAGVFNYTETADDEAFYGWQVEGTDAVYYPGDVIGFGDNEQMWNLGGTPKVLDLYAIIDPVEPSDPTAPATEVKVYIGFTDTGVELMFYGVDGYVPEDISFVLKYSYTYTSGDRSTTIFDNTNTISVKNEDGSNIVIVPITPEMIDGGVLYGAYATVTVGEDTFNTEMITHAPVTAL